MHTLDANIFVRDADTRSADRLSSSFDAREAAVEWAQIGI